MDDLEKKYKRRLDREKRSRKEAEKLLDEKSLELFNSNTALKSLNEELENIVAERTEDLVKTRDEALSLAKVKTDFLANMSHELRTPMNGVLGTLNLLNTTKIDKEQKKLVTTALYSGELLLQLINDILDISKLDAGKLELESTSFNPVHLLEVVIDCFTNEAKQRSITLIADISPAMPYHLIGDPLRIQQVVTNLLSNAIKFTEIGAVTLSSRYVDNNWIISITDTGIGMTQEQAAGVFEEFSQADLSTTRNFGGTGLGLSICKTLISLMSGDISLESEPNKGSTFIVDVPMLIDPTAEKPELAFGQKVYQVIIVNTNEQENSFIHDCLTHWRVDIIQQINSIEHIESELHKLTLNDNSLFIVNDELLEELPDKAKSQINSYKKLLLTDEGKKHSTQHHVSRPVKQSELFNSIADLIGLSLAPIESYEKPQQHFIFSHEHILLVEDNQINQKVAELLLSKVNLTVTIAENGQHALDLIDKEDYKLVLMDIQMPVMDGITSAKHIRKLPNDINKIPIIALTANCFASDKEETKQAGMNGHIGKPIVAEQLYQEIAKYIIPCDDVFVPPIENTKDNWLLADDTRALISNIDFDVLNDKTLGNIEFVCSILTSFSLSTPNEFKQAKIDFQNNQLKDCQRFFHTLKGTSGNIGASTLFDDCTAIDKAFKQQKISSSEIFEQLCNPIEDELNVLINNISRFVAKAPTEKTPDKLEGLSQTERLARINVIESQLYQDTSEAEKLTNALLQTELPIELEQHLKQLQTAISTFDYNEMELAITAFRQTEENV